MSAALHSEWTKLRTVSATAWLLLGVVAATLAISTAAGGLTHVSAATQGGDATKLCLSGVYLGQLIVAAMAVLAISEEYATGMIRVTLAVLPRRVAVLMAKATLLGGLTAAASIVAIAGCLAIGRFMLPADGLDPAHGYALISLGSASTIRAACGTVLYMSLIALLSLGVATLVRDSGVAVGMVVALLFLPPLLAQIVGGSLGRHIRELAPMTAGLAIQATTHLRSLPVHPWAGLGVLAGWAVLLLLLATAALAVRDA